MNLSPALRAALRTRFPARMTKKDVIVILGTTGVGKSALAISLARTLKSECINTDAMQVYKALPVLTAKVTSEEMQGVRHRLLSFLDPKDEYQVLDFKRDAIREIDDLHAEGKIPILVGGTAYYTQHLLYPSTSDQTITSYPASTLEQISTLPPNEQALIHLLPTLPSLNSPSSFPPLFPIHLLPEPYQQPTDLAFALWTIFNTLAPTKASQWHWRDIRKVRRHLEIHLSGTEPESGESKYRNLVFWLHAQKEVLEARLDARVDKMLGQGLVEEITEHVKSMQGEIDFSRGLNQAIGFRPFVEHLQGKIGKEEATELMKLHTRQYAKRQVAWFRVKFLEKARKDEETEVFVLDATDLHKWEKGVETKAREIVQLWAEKKSLPDPLSICGAAELLNEQTEIKSQQKHICETCSESPDRPFMVDENLREVHERSKAHKGRARWLKKQEQRREDYEAT